MSIKFLYPDPEQKEILDELERISFVLNKPVSKELQKNMHFVKNFTYSLLKTGKSHKKPQIIEKQPIIQPIIKTKPLLITIPKESERIIAPPPPPPSITVEKHPTQPTYTKLKKENNILKYESIEPLMEDQDWKLFTKVKSLIKQQLTSNPNILENENFISEGIKKVSKELKIRFSPDYLKKIKYYLIKYIKGFGRIDPLIQDPRVTSIICKSYDDISVIYNNENLLTNIQFDTNEEMNNFILNLAGRFNKRISEDSPYINFSTVKFKISLNYNPIISSSFRIDKL